MPKHDPKLASLLDNATQAFWEVIALAYPQAKHGDLSPESTIQFDIAAEGAVSEWIRNNVPRGTEEAVNPDATVINLLAYLDHNCALFEKFGCVVAIALDGKTIFSCPMLADGSPERYPFDPRYMNWGEVTAPEPGFLELVNDVFGTSFHYEDFAGR